MIHNGDPTPTCCFQAVGKSDFIDSSLSVQGNLVMSNVEEFDLVLTSERVNRRYVVFVRGHQLLLSYNLFELLIQLVERHLHSAGRGFLFDHTDSFRVTVCRLRKSIDQMLGHGTGKQLILTGGTSEYRLVPTLKLALDSRLAEEPGVVPERLLDELVAKYPQLNITPHVRAQFENRLLASCNGESETTV